MTEFAGVVTLRPRPPAAPPRPRGALTLQRMRDPSRWPLLLLLLPPPGADAPRRLLCALRLDSLDSLWLGERLGLGGRALRRSGVVLPRGPGPGAPPAPVLTSGRGPGRGPVPRLRSRVPARLLLPEGRFRVRLPLGFRPQSAAAFPQPSVTQGLRARSQDSS